MNTQIPCSRKLKPPHVVLVHGEANEMSRLKAALLREYENDPHDIEVTNIETQMCEINVQIQMCRCTTPEILYPWSSTLGEKKWPR